MRCLTLAEVLRDSGVVVEFVCRTHYGNLDGLIRQKGFIVHELPYPRHQASMITQDLDIQNEYTQCLVVSQELDAEETIIKLQGTNTDLLVVDHYGLDETWECLMRHHVGKIMVIDDLADRFHDCDILLDQNYFINGKSRYDNLVPPTCTKLLGIQYALLRSEFSEARKKLKPKTGEIHRVLVFFGGTDSDNVTGRALEALLDPGFSHLDVDVVIGTQNPHRTQIEKLVKLRPRSKLHLQIDNIAKLMIQADLFLGAGGTTTWERMCLGLPSLVVTIAKNQNRFTEDLDRDGFLSWLGTSETTGISELKKALLESLENISDNRLKSIRCAKMLKGDGASLVKDFIKKGPSPEKWTVRKANLSDTKLYWNWVNDPEVRKNAFHSDPISWDNHKEWFRNKLDDRSVTMLLVECIEGPIGQVRFEQSGSHLVIDYSIGRQFRRLGLGKIFLSKCIETLRNEKECVLIGKVKEENLASAKIFEHLGFKELTPSRKYTRNFQLDIS